VLGDGGTGDVERGGDLPRRQLSVPDELEDPSPTRLGERSDGGFHDSDI